MPDQSDVKKVEKGSVRSKRRFDARDWDTIADFIIEEKALRKKDRKDLEKQWDDIDRQLRMEPDQKIKLLGNGKPDTRKAWMSELELPLQAETLEVLTADSRRMLFPDSGPWFAAHAETPDEYLEKIDFTSLIPGDLNEVPSVVNQDNVDKLVHGFLSHLHRQYDFRGHCDVINAEAFKYGVGIGRARKVKKPVFIHTAHGVRKEDQVLPVLFPRSIKDVYLPCNKHASMNEGMIVGDSIIHCRTQLLTDLQLAANKGNTDPDNENGGWMPAAVKNLEADDKGNVELLEYEGDLVVPRKTVASMYIPGAIVTVALGASKGGKSSQQVVRFRFRKKPYSSYLLFPYHNEHIDTPYATSPLMKGRTLQIAASAAMNRLMDSAALKVSPPIGYEKDDAYLAQSGGPNIAPYETWETTGEIQVYDTSDPGAMLNVLVTMLQQYADTTGVNQPRLGAQTVSHTTAFAKEAELSRGTIRTVDYVKSIGEGPMERWLDMEYDMGREVAGSDTVWIDAYRSFVSISKEILPEKVMFEWFGAGGPSEERVKAQARAQSLQTALQMDLIAIQAGAQPTLDIPSAIEETLRQGGWTDTDALKRVETVPAGAAGEPAVAGPDQGIEDPGAVSAIVQTLPQINTG